MRVYITYGAGYWGRGASLRQSEEAWEKQASERVKVIERKGTLARLVVDAEAIEKVYCNDMGQLVRPRGSLLWYMEKDGKGWRIPDCDGIIA
jgi:hypothetical protein